MADGRIRVIEPASGEDEGRNCPFYPLFKLNKKINNFRKVGFQTTDSFCYYKHI